MDAISLDVDLDCIVGILPRERIEPQPLRISLRLELDLGPVGDTGALERGVDYAAVDAQVRFLASEGRFRLIESLGLSILRVVLVPPVRRAWVRLAKPTILARSVPSVELMRDVAWATSDRIVRLPEVEVERRVLMAGDTVADGVLFGLAGVTGAVPTPFTAERAAAVLQVRRLE